VFGNHAGYVQAPVDVDAYRFLSGGVAPVAQEAVSYEGAGVAIVFRIDAQLPPRQRTHPLWNAPQGGAIPRLAEGMFPY